MWFQKKTGPLAQKCRGISHCSQRIRAGWFRNVQAVQFHWAPSSSSVSWVFGALMVDLWSVREKTKNNFKLKKKKSRSLPNWWPDQTAAELCFPSGEEHWDSTPTLLGLGENTAAQVQEGSVSTHYYPHWLSCQTVKGSADCHTLLSVILGFTSHSRLQLCLYICI